MYYGVRPTVSQHTIGVTIPVPGLPIIKELPALSGIRMVISRLRSGEAAGICSNPAGLLKVAGEPMAQDLHAVLDVVWESGTISSDLLIVPVPLWND